MPGSNGSASLRILTGALVLSSTFLVNQARAQQVKVTSARLTPTVARWERADSGSVLLAVEITGLSEREQVWLTDDAGRTYKPVGVAMRSLATVGNNIPEYMQAADARRWRPRYLFAVHQGKTRFVLHVPSREPVPFTASSAAAVAIR